jgi:hypothetical protein
MQKDSMPKTRFGRMGASPKVEFTREHELIVRMLVQVTRGIAQKYFPGRPVYHQSELSMMMLYVMIGHIELKLFDRDEVASGR